MTDSKNSRRNFIKNAGIASAGIAGTGILSNQAKANPNKSTKPTQDRPNKPAENVVDFYGVHQAGITTYQQKHIYFLVADLHLADPIRIKKMFQTWTQYSINLTQGKFVKESPFSNYLPAIDTGEAASLNAHNLTLTFGVSPSFLQKTGLDKYRPALFKDLPHLPRDQLQNRFTGGDICIQSCADDPQVAFHAVRNLVRAARANLTLKWSQMGFNSTDHKNQTPRNLFAFKDGTVNNPDKSLWVDSDDWLNNGTYLVARRIQMFLETWDRTSLGEQNNTFGRNRQTGAPMGQKHEHDPVNLLDLPEDSHVRLIRSTGKRIFRRSFSYSSGITEQGYFDAGLLFLSFQNNPQSFIEIQKTFASDKLNEYVTHVGSGIFACFSGVSKEPYDYLGRALIDKLV